MLHCENGFVDFEERDSLELEPHTLELKFETLDEHADKFFELALTEGGANFLLTFDTGVQSCIEVIILEAQHG
jgi:Ni2+-binding GTPase involved in maturation of urease and hydrogenase